MVTIVPAVGLRSGSLGDTAAERSQIFGSKSGRDCQKTILAAANHATMMMAAKPAWSGRGDMTSDTLSENPYSVYEMIGCGVIFGKLVDQSATFYAALSVATATAEKNRAIVFNDQIVWPRHFRNDAFVKPVSSPASGRR